MVWPAPIKCHTVTIANVSHCTSRLDSARPNSMARIIAPNQRQSSAWVGVMISPLIVGWGLRDPLENDRQWIPLTSAIHDYVSKVGH